MELPKVQLSKTGMATLKRRDIFAQGKIITAFKDSLTGKKEAVVSRGKYSVIKVLDGQYSVAFLRPRAGLVSIEAVESFDLASEAAIEKIVNSITAY